MDVSAAEIVLGLVVVIGAVGAVYGARWVSRRSDQQMERTRAALRARHAVPDVPSEGATRLLATARSVTAQRTPARPVPAPPVTVSPPPEPVDEDPESSGRHRVPEELMRAATYSLSPDRVARAKVPGPRPQSNPGQPGSSGQPGTSGQPGNAGQQGRSGQPGNSGHRRNAGQLTERLR